MFGSRFCQRTMLFSTNKESSRSASSHLSKETQGITGFWEMLSSMVITRYTTTTTIKQLALDSLHTQPRWSKSRTKELLHKLKWRIFSGSSTGHTRCTCFSDQWWSLSPRSCSSCFTGLPTQSRSCLLQWVFTYCWSYYDENILKWAFTFTILFNFFPFSRQLHIDL